MIWVIICCLLSAMPSVALAAPGGADSSASEPQNSVTVSGEIISGEEQAAATQSPDYYDSAPEMDQSQVTSESAMLIEADSGTVLFEKNSNERIYPASTTKLMTALLTAENCQLTDMVTLTNEMLAAIGQLSENSSLMHLDRLEEGTEISVKDLLYGLFLRSGNDAAQVLAIHIAGTEDEFVNRMNARARELGMADTHFVNSHGVYTPDEGENHYSTAADMAKLAIAAAEVPVLSEIMGTETYQYESVSGLEENETLGNDVIENSNYLVHTPADHPEYASYIDDRATGMKTGLLLNIQPPEAEDLITSYGCLVASASDGNMDLIALVFGDMSLADDENGVPAAYARWDIARQLFDYGFGNFAKVDIAQYVTAFSTHRQIGDETIEAAADLSGVQPNERLLLLTDAQGLETGTTVLEQQVTMNESIDSSVHTGDEIGRVAYLLDGWELYSAPLIAAGMLQTVPAADPAEEVGDGETGGLFVFQLWYLWIIVPAGVFLTLLIIRTVNLGRRRRRRGLYAARRRTLADIRPGARKNIPPDIIPTVVPKNIRPVKPIKRKINHDNEKE